MNEWKKIWSSKRHYSNSDFTLSDLIKINGFDTGVGSYSESGWNLLVNDIANKIQIKDDYEILDIGCGSGAFFYPLSERYNLKYTGIDYSESLINIAKKVFPKHEFHCVDALNFKFIGEKYNSIISHSVFNYFDDLCYAQNVLNKCYYSLKPNGTLSLLDLNNIDTKDIYDKERQSRFRDPEEYKKLYKNLNFLFYDKNKLKKFLKKIGFKEVVFFKHAVPNYGNAKFRFNIFAKK